MSQRVLVVPREVRLVVEVSGAGRPVVLLHGGGQTRASWGKAVDRLVERGCECWAVDLRGHGDSDWAADGDYSVERVAADLLEVLAQIGRPATVIGASFGGVAALVAAGTPDAHLIEAVVLVDVVPRMRPAGIERIRSFMTSHPDGFEDLDEARAAVASYLPHRQAWGSGLERNLRRRPDGRLRWHWDPALLAIDPSLPDTVALIEDSVHRITVPISLVRGLLSDVVDDAGVEALRALCPHLSVVDLPRASHTAAADDNDAFAEAVTARLVGHRAEP